ncbi:slit homolog 2 protein-like [Littorina saxatilis]|uniref:LRRCT domain-containing protein n=1 Tax=Littorina saxatilis TaxID=31220 RepID=A0AAN9AXV1_9CAEN
MATTATLSVCNLLLSLLTTTTMIAATPTPPQSPRPDCPTMCTCTDDNLTVNCSNRGFLRLPHLSPLITKLDLSNNLLGPMINGSFERLRHLREVDLSRNNFIRLQLCTFTGLLHLRKVDLHGNRLRSLPSSLFADNGELEVLDLSHNDFDELPDLLLHSIPSLKVLNMSHNRASRLKLGLRFQLLTQIQVLDLSHNPFTNASSDAFEMAETWNHLVPRSLDLSHCQLQDFDANALTSIPGLKNLSLAGNSMLSFSTVVDVLKTLETSGLEVVNLSNMSIADPGLFSDVRLMLLKDLDLSGNLIGSVPAATFGNIGSLERLDISGNLLTSLDEGFEDLMNLVELNISHCRLSSFKGSPVGRMQQLNVLDLSHNRLLDATEVSLSALRGLRELDLSFNTLQAVVLPGDCSHLVTLNFASNALTSLPSMPNMRSLRFFDAHDNNVQSLSAFLFTEASHIEVANFSQNDLASVDHRAFLPASPQVIDLSHNFLTHTQFFSWTTTKEVYLHNNKLNFLDQQTFYGMDRMKVLDLRHNNLSTLDDNTFKYLSNLSSLRLSDNSLQMIDFFGLFRSLKSLENLDLGYNLIKEMNTTSFKPLIKVKVVSLRKNKMKVVPAELFEDLEKLEEVDVSGNPFHCGCELLPLQAWLKKTKVQIRQRFDLNLTNMCQSPPEHRGKLVTMYEVGQFQCNTKMLYMIVFGSVGALGIVVGVISSLVCHYYSKWRKTHGGKPHHHHHKHKKTKDDNRKEKNINRVDLVRVSKRSDPYGKQELVNGWVASKQLKVADKNLDPQSHKKHQQGPPRPPWPERLSGHSRRDEKERKERSRSMPRQEAVDYSRRNSADRRIRSVSESVPLRASQQHYRNDRARSAGPVRDDRYYQQYPPFAVSLRHVPDRWEEAQAYPSWNPPPAVRGMNYREAGRYYTLPYPAPWPRNLPYGPDYPYRVRRSEEEEYHRARQTRALPYPPRDINRDRQTPNGYRNNQHPDHERYVQPPRHSEYENVREYREGGQRIVRDERAYQEPSPDHRQEYESRRQAEERKEESNEQGKEMNGNEENRTASEQTNPMKRGTSDAQIHRRDSEYRNAMDNPIGPRAASSPVLADDKASDWL